MLYRQFNLNNEVKSIVQKPTKSLIRIVSGKNLTQLIISSMFIMYD